MKHFIKKINLGCLVIGCCSFIACTSTETEVKDYTQFVNPFIGTLHEGHCFPGATLPTGFVQASPESHTAYYKGYEGDHVTGYQYTDSLLKGFTQTHMNGVGCPSMSDILLMPYCDRKVDSSNLENFYSDYDKSTEKAKPGYYSVGLKRNGVKAEMTTSAHAAYHQYTYQSNEARLLVDLQYSNRWDVNTVSEGVAEATQQFEGKRVLTGYRKAVEWTNRKVFYVIEFSEDIKNIEQLEKQPNEKANRYVLSFDLGAARQLQVRIGLSSTSIEAAKENLHAEIPEWNTFDKVKDQARRQWNDILSKVDAQGKEDQLVSFYTSLYHLYSQPSNMADVSGKYRASDDQVHTAKGGAYYSTFSLWDTFRAANPMYTILTPEFIAPMVESLMESYQYKQVEEGEYRFLPRWYLWGNETNTMIANHAVPVIVDAYLKNLLPSTFSVDSIFEAVLTSVSKPHYRNHVELIEKYGYIPYDVKMSKYDDGRETVARLLEGIYDDYCTGVMAERLGKKEIAGNMFKRAKYYKNVYNPETGFMVGRNGKGEFQEVDPTEVIGEWLPNSSYTEGNSWHYLFHVMHDVPGMIDLMGGKEKFTAKLDSMFYTNTNPEVKTLVWKIIGTLGQYWHGNEPCHHVPYLYKYTDEGYKTDAILHSVVDKFYKNEPGGLKGNDDCGQMSAWYMFASMGFYPVDPISGEFILSAPQLPSLTLNLKSGKKFEVTTENYSDNNIFVKEVYLNGKLLDRPYITYKEIMDGGSLKFVMTDREDREDLLKFTLR